MRIGCLIESMYK